MYPLNLEHKTHSGFAVANDEDEHIALTERGYEPAFVGKKRKAKEQIDSAPKEEIETGAE